jgi:hypothetical protein
VSIAGIALAARDELATLELVLVVLVAATATAGCARRAPRAAHDWLMTGHSVLR